MTVISVQLSPYDVWTIRGLLEFERDRYNNQDKDLPPWVFQALRKFIKETQQQDTEHSKQRVADEAEYKYDVKTAEGVAWLMFHWFKYMHENRRKHFMDHGVMQAVTSVFAVAEKFLAAHEELYETMWSERYSE